jgi:hypothetical protein
MAEKSLVYRINFDGLEAQAAAIGKVDNELTTLNQTIKRNRADLVNYTELNMQNTQAYADLTEELGQNIVQQRNLTKAKGDLIRETQNEAKVLKENEGSIVSLRAQLSNLTKEYNNLTRAERESAKGKDVQNQAKAISDELKKLESAVGNTSRNVGNYKEALGELETSLKQLLQAQAAARKSGQENNAVFVANEAAIQALAQEYQVLAQSEKEVDNQLKALTATENEAGASAESLKSKLRALKEAAAVAGEGTEDFQRLTAEAAKLQDAVDDANEAIKQEKGTEFEKFREQLGGVGQSLGNLDFKQANERIAQLGTTLKGLTFSSLKDGLKGAGSSFTAFGRVLLANPIFLIAAIAAAVGIALFALKDKVKIIGQAFELATLGPRLLIQAFKDLGDAIGVTSFAADEAAEKTAKALEKEAEAVRTNTDFYANQLDRKIAVLKAAGQDTTEEELKRLRELEAGAKKERDIQEQQIYNKQKQIEAGRVLSEDEQKQFDDEKKRLDELREAYANASNDILVFYATKKKAAADDADADAKKAADDAKKAADDAKRKRDEFEAANKQLIEQTKVANANLIADEKLKAEALAKIAFDAEVKNINNSKASKTAKDNALKAAEKTYQNQLIKINEDANAKKLADDAKADADAKALRLAALNEELTEIDIRLLQVEKGSEEELTILQERLDKELEIKLQSVKAGSAAEKLLIEQSIADATKLEEDAAAKRNEQKTKVLTEREEERVKRAEDAAIALELASNTINTLAQLKDMETEQNLARINKDRDAQIAAIQNSTLSEEAKAKKIAEINAQAQAKADAERKKQAESQKRLALIQIALDTGVAIASTVVQATKAGWPAMIPAIATGIAAVLAGIVSATAAVNAAKFALGGEIPMDGGFITGNSHANGGVKFSAGGRLMEAEGGEIIVNKGIQKRPDFVRAISQMNYMTGGKKFETGGIVAPVFSAAGASLAASEQNLGGGFTFEIPPIQVLNNVVDTTSQQSSIIQIQNQTSIGG